MNDRWFFLTLLLISTGIRLSSCLRIWSSKPTANLQRKIKPKKGPNRDLNPGPRTIYSDWSGKSEARIMLLDHWALLSCRSLVAVSTLSHPITLPSANHVRSVGIQNSAAMDTCAGRSTKTSRSSSIHPRKRWSSWSFVITCSSCGCQTSVIPLIFVRSVLMTVSSRSCP